MVDTYEISGGMEVAARSGVSTGLNITTGSSHSKGAYSEFIASTANDCQGLLIGAQKGEATEHYLLDIAIGTGGAEVDIISNIYYKSDGRELMNQTGLWLPIHIDAGSRISGRAQSESSSHVLNIHMNMVDAKGTSVGYTTCQTIGANTGTSRGTNVDSGGVANTKGAWSEISSSISGNWKKVAWSSGAGGDESASEDGDSLVDIGVGPAASEVVIFGDYPAVTEDFFDKNVFETYGAFPMKIDSGSRVAVRHQCSSIASDMRLIDVVLYGFHN